MKIGIVLGSIREGRNNEVVGKWVKEVADNFTSDFDFEIVDLMDYPLPMFDEATSPAFATELKAGERQRKWAEKVTELDGFIFITPEYNHGLPSVLKNAIDYVYNEFTDKAAGIVSYGSAGGVRSAEQLRTVLSELQVAHVRTQPALSLFHDWNEEGFNPSNAQLKAVETMLYQLSHWTKAMADVRKAKAAESK